MVLGVCGLYGSGKSLISKYLESRGFSVINLDALGHEALTSLKKQVVSTFGKQIVNEKGQINRRALGDIVFADKLALKKLEGLLHPKMKEMVKDRVKDHSKIVIDGVLLFKMDLHEICHAVIWVAAPWNQRLIRARKRDSLTFLQLLERFSSQKGIQSQAFLSDTDIFKVKNTRKKSYALKQVDRILSKLGNSEA